MPVRFNFLPNRKIKPTNFSMYPYQRRSKSCGIKYQHIRLHSIFTHSFIKSRRVQPFDMVHHKFKFKFSSTPTPDHFIESTINTKRIKCNPTKMWSLPDKCNEESSVCLEKWFEWNSTIVSVDDIFPFRSYRRSIKLWLDLVK